MVTEHVLYFDLKGHFWVMRSVYLAFSLLWPGEISPDFPVFSIIGFIPPQGAQ